MTTTAHEDQFVTDLSEDSAPATILDDYDKGWIECAKWANNTDLICDIGSPAYNRDKQESLKPRRPHNAVAGVYSNIRGHRGIE